MNGKGPVRNERGRSLPASRLEDCPDEALLQPALLDVDAVLAESERKAQGDAEAAEVPQGRLRDEHVHAVAVDVEVRVEGEHGRCE